MIPAANAVNLANWVQVGNAVRLGPFGGSIIQALINGFKAPDSLTTGPLYVEDYQGTLVTPGADKIAIPGMRLDGTEFVNDDGAGNALVTSQQLRTRQGTETHYNDADFKGMMVMPARTNKITCRKVNPVDTTNILKSGDAAAVLSVVDDTAALTAAGLIGICTSGKVYKLDNSIGVDVSFASIVGSSVNTNQHQAAIYVKSTGGGRWGFDSIGVTLSTPFGLLSSYTRVIHNGVLDIARGTRIHADAGSIVYFILPELIEAPFLDPSPVVPDVAHGETDALTSYTRSATVASYNTANYLRTQNCALWLRRYITAAGQTDWIVNSYTDANNEIGVQVTPTTIILRKRIGGVDYDATLTYTHIEGFNDIRPIWTDKGISVQASDDRGATWSAWADNADTTPAVIAATVQNGRNGADQVACHETFTASAFLPARATLADYQNWVETNAQWNKLGVTS